nr:2-phosphosulfolactate phosphatase [Pirellula staleyi]
MSRRVVVHLLPSQATTPITAGKTVAVIDVLRATTTIVTAMAAGAARVVPLLEVDEARARAAAIGESALLGGERHGKRIDGFHFGNSPAEYTRDKLAGKTLVFTTTNGTRAMLAARQAREIYVASFVNFSAICRELAEREEVHILCAGTDGEVTREDTLLAGAIADDAVASDPATQLNDEAEIAADAWRAAVTNLSGRVALAQAMRQSRGGRNLIEIGHEHDIDLAAEIDRFDLTPRLDVAKWEIVLP